ncbi:hypothetical protein Vlu01_45050 [Micromonospora lutea]|uniref:Uncharacterized protein n=1 Tax=Micromonospora lutea TaxID=419825 RepID=A0ABQ4J129_9ACTN|nr:hypothetical protein Vlu01_45050 [Micromonospora lutea]
MRVASSSIRGPICWTRIVGRDHSGFPDGAGPAPVEVDPSGAGDSRSTSVCSSSSTGRRGVGPVGDSLGGATDGAVCDGSDGASPEDSAVAAVAADGTTGAGGTTTGRVRSTGGATAGTD